MALADLVSVSTSTTGTGTLSLGSATAGFRTFADAVTAGDLADGATVTYGLISGSGDRESGYGIYTAGSPDTLTRNLLSSSTGSLLSLTGTSTVFTEATAADLAFATDGAMQLTGAYLGPAAVFGPAYMDSYSGIATAYPVEFRGEIIDAVYAHIIHDDVPPDPSDAFRVGLYARGVDGLPGALIEQSSPLSLETPGLVGFELAAPMRLMGLYWFVFITNSENDTVGIQTAYKEGGRVVPTNSSYASNGNLSAALIKTMSYGALPDPFGTADSDESFGPIPFLRLA